MFKHALLALASVVAFAQITPIPGGGGGGGGCVAGAGIACTGSTISVDTAVIQSRATAQAGTSIKCTTSTSTSAPVCSLTPTLTAYTDGMVLSVSPHATFSATATLNVDALGARKVYKMASGAPAQIDATDVLSTGKYLFIYSSALDSSTGGFFVVPLAGGSVFTIPFTNYVPAAKCQSGAAGLSTSYPVTNAPTAFCDTTATNAVFATARFTATAQSIQDHFRLPSDQTGALDFWISTRAVSTTGNQLWDLQTACVATSETFNPTFNTAQTITIATAGTTLQQTAGSQAGVTQTGCAAGEVLMWKLTLSASTTTTGNIDLIEYGWTVRRTI